MKIGGAIKAAREEAGMLQAQLAEKAKLDPSYMSMLENDKKSPTLTVFFRIAKALKMSPTELMSRIETSGRKEK